MLLDGEKMSENDYGKWRSEYARPTVEGEKGRDVNQMTAEHNT